MMMMTMLIVKVAKFRCFTFYQCFAKSTTKRNMSLMCLFVSELSMKTPAFVKQKRMIGNASAQATPTVLKEQNSG